MNEKIYCVKFLNLRGVRIKKLEYLFRNQFQWSRLGTCRCKWLHHPCRFLHCCMGFPCNHWYLKNPVINVKSVANFYFNDLSLYLLSQCSKIILMPQSSPINPCAQLQVKELMPSTHTPPFLQGLDLQSLISKNKKYSRKYFYSNTCWWR